MKISLLFQLFLIFLLLLCIFYEKQISKLYTLRFDSQKYSVYENIVSNMSYDETKKITERDNSNALELIKSHLIKKPTNIQNIKKSSISPNLPLHQLCIKGSYNTAYTGSSYTSYGYISIDMLKYVLCRGCRYLDFQVFYLSDSNNNMDVCVGYSNDNSVVNVHNINNIQIRFYDILEAVILNGLSPSDTGKSLGLEYSTPNIEDPLFIQIRIHPESNDKKVLLNKVQDIITELSEKSYYSNYFSKVNVDKDTYIKDIMNKIIFVFEHDVKLYSEDRVFYKNYMTKFSRLYLDDGFFHKKLYSDLDKTHYRTFSPKIVRKQTANGEMYPMIDTNTITVVCPNTYGSDPQNMNIYTSLRDYGYQINLLQYYVKDTSSLQFIQKSENLFDSFGFSFVPMHSAILYVNSK